MGKRVWGSFGNYFSELATLDLRSLALMRIAYGLIALFDLLNRTRDFRLHYTSEGALPREMVLEHALSPGDWSLYLLFDSTPMTMVLYGIHLAAVCCLLLGWRTRVATVLCWVLFASLHDRNFAILNSGDNWLRITLFWSIFLPWGHKWSLDEQRYGQKGVSWPITITSMACFAYVFQEFSVYFFSGYFKTGDSWHVDGSAVYLAMHLNDWSGFFSRELLYFPKLMATTSHTVVWLELLLPLLLFSPWLRGPIRTLLAILFVIFHAALLPILSLGIFPFVGMASALGLIPTWAWKRWPWRSLTEPSTSLAGQHKTEFFGQKKVCQVFVSVALGLGLYWNVNSLSLTTKSTAVKVVTTALNLDQNWALFAPNPPTESGWMVVVGELETGQTVDLINEARPATFVKPRLPFRKYHSQRQKRFFYTLSQRNDQWMKTAYAQADSKLWLDAHPGENLRSLRAVWLSQPTLPNYEVRPISERTVAEWTRDS